MTIKLTENYLKALVANTEELRRLACRYVNEQQSVGRRQSDSDEISFDGDSVVWKYKYNDACNCHPEWKTEEVFYPMKDFVDWVNEKNIEVEQYSENGSMNIKSTENYFKSFFFNVKSL